ncbi:MAG: glycosyltransferase [Weeksellaceae bacterium]|jgi:glycosyltransferase involved in cell wall biosynthesis|nr:glycosyltransferase [Weeksellaceae bacterium]
MKVSVIVPVYNTEKYLPKCLDSLVSQTLDEMEILVVNDGSPDNSQKIIDEYSAKFPQIKSFQKPNGGLSDARNFGIEKANGKFIGFVDSDDYVHPEMFETLYKKAREHQAEIVLCDLQKVNEKGEVFRALPQSPQLPEKIDLTQDFRIFGEMSCFACNKLFKSELFENHAFKKGIHFEDIELIPQLILQTKVLAKVNQPFYNYFERQDSITRTHTEKGLDMFIAIKNVKNSFGKSKYRSHQKEWKRFFILQAYYSYLAYVGYVKDKKLKEKLLLVLDEELRKNEISRWEIFKYKRFNQNYLFSLPLQKQIFYLLSLIHLKLIQII